jgi:predicted DNA-binding transcriptional regulator AlpA
VTPRSNNPEPKKAAISIQEMAAQCGLSRQRFMQLVKAGVFPAPLYDGAN